MLTGHGWGLGDSAAAPGSGDDHDAIDPATGKPLGTPGGPVIETTATGTGAQTQELTISKTPAIAQVVHPPCTAAAIAPSIGDGIKDALAYPVQALFMGIPNLFAGPAEGTIANGSGGWCMGTANPLGYRIGYALPTLALVGVVAYFMLKKGKG